MWKQFVRWYPGNKHLSPALQSVFRDSPHSSRATSKISFDSCGKDEYKFWSNCIRSNPGEEHLCQRLAEAFHARRHCQSDASLAHSRGEEIDIWASLWISLVDRGVTEKQSCILHFLANAIKERADAVVSEDFELAMKGWKDAKELWDEIACDIPAPLSRKMIAEGGQSIDNCWDVQQ